MFKEISKEEAIEIAKEFNRTHPTKIKYIVKSFECVWEGWDNKPMDMPSYWARDGHGWICPVILSPTVNDNDWKNLGDWK
jgi:hypothetical protein